MEVQIFIICRERWMFTQNRVQAHKQSHKIWGRCFVLTANGIESPKLLLMSQSKRFPAGIANRSGMVGRNLMDHPGASVIFFADEPVYFGRGPMRPGSINNTRDGPFRRERSAVRTLC
nr:hypothetical protein [Candidatus Sodalis pierantonius]